MKNMLICIGLKVAAEVSTSFGQAAGTPSKTLKPGGYSGSWMRRPQAR